MLKTCLELCDIFRKASSNKMQPHCTQFTSLILAISINFSYLKAVKHNLKISCCCHVCHFEHILNFSCGNCLFMVIFITVKQEAVWVVSSGVFILKIVLHVTVNAFIPESLHPTIFKIVA